MFIVERFGSTPNKVKELSSNKVKAGFQVCGLCIHAFADEVQVGKKSIKGETMMWPLPDVCQRQSMGT